MHQAFMICIFDQEVPPFLEVNLSSYIQVELELGVFFHKIVKKFISVI